MITTAAQKTGINHGAILSLLGSDPISRDLLFQVYAAAWRELALAGRVPPSERARNHARQRLTCQLAAAADSGERDFERLKAKAIDGID